ncbi:MAG: hypothetical protein AB9869_29815 [Verrucomicrobiia bacterium]
MSCIEVTQVERAGSKLRRVGLIAVDPRQIVARAQTPDYTALYLRPQRKVFVHETLEEIEGLIRHMGTQRILIKRFKRSIRESKAMGIPVDQAFAALWEEIVAEGNLTDAQLGDSYQALVNWTKRWLK